MRKKISTRKQLKIITKSTEIVIKLTGDNPKTTETILKELPIEARANVFGDEIYFFTPLKIEEEEPKEFLEVGDAAFWPFGNAICVSLGLLKSSKKNKLKSFSKVNVFGKIVRFSPEILKKIQNGDTIRIDFYS